MDIPPLAGKIAALSLGALPLSYVLSHVSALSQCVRGGAGAASGEGERGTGTAVAGGEDARAASLAPRALSPYAAPAGREGARPELSPTMQPEGPFPRAWQLCVDGGEGGRGAPRTFWA